MVEGYAACRGLGTRKRTFCLKDRGSSLVAFVEVRILGICMPTRSVDIVSDPSSYAILGWGPTH